MSSFHTTDTHEDDLHLGDLKYTGTTCREVCVGRVIKRPDRHRWDRLICAGTEACFDPFLEHVKRQGKAYQVLEDVMMILASLLKLADHLKFV